MKKIIFFVLSVLCVVPISTFAFKWLAGDTLDITTPLVEDYYVAGGTVHLDASVSEDLTIAGWELTINGAVGKDLTIAGWDITIDKNVWETAKVAWWTITINSTFGKDLIVAGGEITLWKNAVIQWDTIIGGGMVTVDGTTHDANLSAGELTIWWTIKGNAVIKADKIYITTGAKILWNLEYTSSVINTELEHIVAGKVTFTQVDFDRGFIFLGTVFGGYMVLKFLFLLVFGILLLFVGRKRFVSAIAALKAQPFLCLWYGILPYILVPFAIIVLLISLIGIPFAAILIALYATLFAFYKLFNVVFYSQFFIEKMGGKDNVALRKQIWIVVLCVLISSIVSMIDIVFTFFALGSVIKTLLPNSKK